MLESNVLLGLLLNIASKTDATIQKNIALDILLWIISIRMTRFRSPKLDGSTSYRQYKTAAAAGSSSGTQSPGTHSTQDIVVDMYLQQIDCVNIVQANITELMRNCILAGNRSTANKCVKVILITLE